jgi:integrase
MLKHNASNERIKYRYFVYLKEAKHLSEQTLDAAAKALVRFESHTQFKDFRAFHYQQAIAFKAHLANQKNQKSGQPLSKATLYSTLAALQRFFQWLAGQPSYKSRLKYSDADYFNLSDNDIRIATARRTPNIPTIEQIMHVITTMSAKNDIELRNRALLAFTILTGARDGAIASMKLKHVDLIRGCVQQDAREVKTKFRKTFTTYFFPIEGCAQKIFNEWVHHLQDKKLWGNNDPLFPATQVDLSPINEFEVTGLDKNHWSNATPIRKIFRDAFEKAGLPYFTPHSFRHTLVRLGESLCNTPEDFKAWSQNLGHEAVLTTFLSYGTVGVHRQGEIIQNLNARKQLHPINLDDFAEAIARKLKIT